VQYPAGTRQLLGTRPISNYTDHIPVQKQRLLAIPSETTTKCYNVTINPILLSASLQPFTDGDSVLYATSSPYSQAVFIRRTIKHKHLTEALAVILADPQQRPDFVPTFQVTVDVTSDDTAC